MESTESNHNDDEESEEMDCRAGGEEGTRDENVMSRMKCEHESTKGINEHTEKSSKKTTIHPRQSQDGSRILVSPETEMNKADHMISAQI